MSAVTFLLAYSMLIIGLNKIEDYFLENELHSVRITLNRDLESLLRVERDYAFWDDMYNYVNRPNNKWAKKYVTDWIPRNFKIDLILIFDNAGKLLYQYGNFKEFKIGKDFSNEPSLKRIFESDETKGLYSTSKEITLIASSGIMHTDGVGPRNGTYLYGKVINKYVLEELKDITGLEISILSERRVENSTLKEQILRPKDAAGIYNELKNKDLSQFSIYKPSYKFAFIYSCLRDIEGKDIGILELIRPRKSIVLLRSFFVRVSIWIFIAIILSVFIGVLTTTNFILKPLDILKKTIAEIKKTGETFRRTELESSDEIGILAKDFNDMMEALNQSQNKLMQAQQSLIKSEKMATAAELAMGTVHQINNPLAIAIGRIQLLRRIISYKTHIPEADLEKDLTTIENQTKRAIDITNNLLHYAAPITSRFEKCNINNLLKDTLVPIKALLDSEKINIVTNLNPDLPFMEYCDPQQIKDVFMNIIMNAQQAMSGGGQLAISTDYDKTNDMILVKFTDNGPGINPENIKKIFTPFFSTKADKRGLGLAISYNIVKSHHGAIEVESEVGLSSTFTVKLPVRWKA